MLTRGGGGRAACGGRMAVAARVAVLKAAAVIMAVLVVAMTTPLACASPFRHTSEGGQERPNHVVPPGRNGQHLSYRSSNARKWIARQAAAKGAFVLPSGLVVRPLHAPTPDGRSPGHSGEATVVHSGRLATKGRQFDAGKHRVATSNASLVDAWRLALPLMCEGEEWELSVPPELAHGEPGHPVHGIPPSAAVLYHITLVEVHDDASYDDDGVSTSRRCEDAKTELAALRRQADGRDEL